MFTNVYRHCVYCYRSGEDISREVATCYEYLGINVFLLGIILETLRIRH